MKSTRWGLVLKGVGVVFAITLAAIYITSEARNADSPPAEPPADAAPNASADNPEDHTEPAEPEESKVPEFDLNEALSKTGTIRPDSILEEFEPETEAENEEPDQNQPRPEPSE